jgi:hypothetical protein
MLEFRKKELIGNIMKFTIADLKKERGYALDCTDYNM